MSDQEFVNSSELQEVAIQHRSVVALLAGAVVFFALTGAVWAFLLGQMFILKILCVAAAAMVAALILMEPLIGLCLMVFLVPIESVRTFAGGWLTPTKLVGLVTFPAFLINGWLRRSTIHFDKQSRWMFAFALWSALSFLWAKERTSVPFLVLTIAQLTLFWVLIRTCVTDAQALVAVCMSFVVGTVCGILISVIAPRWGLAPRLMYTTGNPNHLARDIVVSLILVVYYTTRFRSWVSLGAISAGGFLLLGLVLTQSRAGWLGALCAVPFILHGHRKAISFAAVGMMGFLAIVLFSMGVLSAHLGVTSAALQHRWESMFHPRVMRASRIDVWRAGIKLGSRYPILGVGAGAFIPSVPDVIETMPDYMGAKVEISAHNSFLCAFAELGVLGVVLLTGILWHCGRSIADQPYSTEKMIAWALLVASLVQMMTMTAHYQKTIWLSLALSQVLIGKPFAGHETTGNIFAFNTPADG